MITQTIKKHESEVFSCKKCNEIEHCTPGYGSYEAELMIIGQSLHTFNPETPLRQIPFIGYSKNRDSGVMLYQALGDAGYSFKNNNLYITNVLHGNPPKNRPSTKEEINNCKDYLSTELSLVDPRIVVLLGKDAREWFLLAKPLDGKFVSISQHKSIYKFIIGCHPSYILRSGGKYIDQWKTQLVDALQEAKNGSVK